MRAQVTRILRMFGLSRPDHYGGDVAGVEEADRAVEDVEGEGLGPVRGLHLAVDPEFAGDERGNCGFTEKVVAVDAGVDDQTERCPIKAAAVKARRCGLNRELY